MKLYLMVIFVELPHANKKPEPGIFFLSKPYSRPDRYSAILLNLPHSDEKASSGHLHTDQGFLNDAVGPVPVVRGHTLDPRLQSNDGDPR